MTTDALEQSTKESKIIHRIQLLYCMSKVGENEFLDTILITGILIHNE